MAKKKKRPKKELIRILMMADWGSNKAGDKKQFSASTVKWLVSKGLCKVI